MILDSILSLATQYKSYLIATGAIIALFVALYLWHLSAVQSATDARDVYWTNLIKNSPVKIDTVTIWIEKKIPDIEGTAAALAQLDQLTQANKATIDSILKTVANKDSLITTLYIPQSAIIRDTALGKLSLFYKPLNKQFDWSLTERPPIREKETIITKEKIVPLPFRTFALDGILTTSKQIFLGASLRSDNWIFGAGYDVLGLEADNKWSSRLQIRVSYFIW
jgi:hypothetical protein